MQSDVDAQLTNSSEETLPRDFVTAMQGYERQQVDEHISQSEAHRQLHEQQRPTYSGLGTRIEQLLRLAEEQATELVQAAGSEASEIKAATRADAAELRAGAENEAAELRANAKREPDNLCDSADPEAV